MPLEKQSLNNFLPDGFETLNQEGHKENFSEDKIKAGYEKDIPDIVSGPNLNNLIDVVGKNTNILSKFLDFIKNMPINSVLKINNNNQIDYQDIGDIDNKVSKSGDTMTGYLLGVTPPTGDNSTKIATTAFVNTVLPAGTIISSGCSSTPTGYLYCNGSAVSRTTYANLFSAIGTTYGAGDGSTTFNLPNYSNYNFVTSATVSVKGNGNAIGFQNASQNIYGWYNGTGGFGLGGSIYSTPPVKGHTTKGTNPTEGSTWGLSTNASNSGITGSVTTAKINWYIKY